MKTLTPNRWNYYGLTIGLFVMSFALLGWGVQVKMSTRLHADMDAHESAIKMPRKAVLNADAPDLNNLSSATLGHAQFEMALFSGSPVLLATLLSSLCSATFKRLCDALSVNNAAYIIKHLHSHQSFFRPPPIGIGL
jgi:hypothetical protein